MLKLRSPESDIYCYICLLHSSCLTYVFKLVITIKRSVPLAKAAQKVHRHHQIPWIQVSNR